MKIGIVIVTHIFDIANGLPKIIKEIAPNVPVTAAGGDAHNQVGTDFDKIVAAIENNDADEVVAFYDFGAARVNLEMASKLTSKTVHLNKLALVEGTYATAALLEVDVPFETIEAQLADLAIHK